MRLVTLLLVGAAAHELGGNHPVQKVITLLEAMQKDVQRSKEEDEALYKQMDCWCTANKGTKTEAVKAAQKRIEQLKADIESNKALAAKMEGEIADAHAEKAQHEQSLATAKVVREKEHEEFMAVHGELVGFIDQLEKALQVLGTLHAPKPKRELTRPQKKSLLQLHSTLRTMQASPSFGSVMQGDLLKVLAAFPDQTKGTALTQQPIYDSYASRSGEIFGILKQMKADMESDAGVALKKEKAAAASFKELVATKRSEIETLNDMILDKNTEMADARVAAAAAEGDIKDELRQIDADQKFMLEVEDKCKNWDGAYEERQKTRSEEAIAIAEALKVLTTDSAFDSFSSSFNFLQLGHGKESAVARRSAAVLLRRAFAADASAQMVGLMLALRLDKFTKVKAMMDKMVARLQEEQANEVQDRDQCVADLAKNDKNRDLSKNKADDLSASVEELASELDSARSTIAELKDSIAETQKQVQRAGDNRGRENEEFQQQVKDMRDSKRVLGIALERLMDFYAKGTKKYAQPSLLQRSRLPDAAKEEGPKEPGNFKAYQRQGGAGSVLQMLRQIIGDVEKELSECHIAEDNAQKNYESFVRDSNIDIKQYQETIADKTEFLGQGDMDLVAQKDSLRVEKELGDKLFAEGQDLHASCDFLLRNFDLRQKGRNDEIDAVRAAKSILSGGYK